jgi:hypothetical protein
MTASRTQDIITPHRQQFSIARSLMALIMLIFQGLILIGSPEAMAQEDTGRIIGFVRQAGGEEPIAGATVFLGGSAINPHRQQTTGELGGFEFHQLPGGHYVIEVDAEDFHSGRIEFDLPVGGVEDPVFHLEPIDSPPRGRIIVRVREAEGEAPIAGAHVFLMGSTLDHHRSLVTNALGRVEFEEVPGGHYVIEVAAEGFHSARIELHLSEGGVEDPIILLEPLAPRLGRIIGYVRNRETLEPIAGTTVFLGGGSLGEPRHQTTTHHGGFVFEELAPGEYVLETAPEGFNEAREEVHLAAGEVEEVDLLVERLRPDPEELGRIVGVVRNAHTDEPIAGAHVFLIGEALDEARIQETDERGHFRFHEVPSGHYVLEVEAEGFRPGREEVEVEAGHLTEIGFRLHPRRVPEEGLFGQVVDAATGEPLEGVWVAIHRSDHDWLTRHHRLVRRTAADGTYEFQDLRPGLYGVHAALDDYEPASKTAEVESGAGTRCDFELFPHLAVGAIEGVVRDAASGLPIEGALVFLPSFDRPHFSSPLNAPHARTGPDGSYRIERVRPGRRTVVAFDLFHIPDAQLIAIVVGETTDLDFDLVAWPPGLIHWNIRVLNALTGEPVVGVRVHIPVTTWLAPGSDWDPWWEETDSEGWAIIRDVPGGDWRLVGSRLGFLGEIQPLRPDAEPQRLSGMRLSAVDQTITLLLELTDEPNAARLWMLYP